MFRQSCIIYKTYFNNYLSLDSIEEAEIIKLTSNTYRDFKFAFANEINRIANQNKLSGSALIKKLIMVIKEMIYLYLA